MSEVVCYSNPGSSIILADVLCDVINIRQWCYVYGGRACFGTSFCKQDTSGHVHVCRPVSVFMEEGLRVHDMHMAYKRQRPAMEVSSQRKETIKFSGTL